jgi:hypothetical protein
MSNNAMNFGGGTIQTFQTAIGAEVEKFELHAVIYGN